MIISLIYNCINLEKRRFSSEILRKLNLLTTRGKIVLH